MKENQTIANHFKGGVNSMTRRIESSKGMTRTPVEAQKMCAWILPNTVTVEGSKTNPTSQFHKDYLPSEVFIYEALGFTPQEIVDRKVEPIYLGSNTLPVVDYFIRAFSIFSGTTNDDIINMKLVASRKDNLIQTVFHWATVLDSYPNSSTLEERMKTFQTKVTEEGYLEKFFEQILEKPIKEFQVSRVDLYTWNSVVSTVNIGSFQSGIVDKNSPEDLQLFKAMGEVDQLVSWVEYISTPQNIGLRGLSISELYSDTENTTVKNNFTGWLSVPKKNRIRVSTPRETLVVFNIQYVTDAQCTDLNPKENPSMGICSFKYSTDNRSTCFKILSAKDKLGGQLDIDYTVITIDYTNGKDVKEIRQSIGYNGASSTLQTNIAVKYPNIRSDIKALISKLDNDINYNSVIEFRQILDVEDVRDRFIEFIDNTKLLESEFFSEKLYNEYKTRLDKLGIKPKKFLIDTDTVNKLENMGTEFGMEANPSEQF